MSALIELPNGDWLDPDDVSSVQHLPGDSYVVGPRWEINMKNGESILGEYTEEYQNPGDLARMINAARRFDADVDDRLRACVAKAAAVTVNVQTED